VGIDRTIGIGPQTRLLVLTGAGVSAESGLPTFRGAGGLWEGHPVQQVATPEAFESDPALVWRFYSKRRRDAHTVSPNPGHHALVEVERRMGERFLLVTQNVDELHRRAGSRRLIEIHGRLFQTRCSRCAREPFDDEGEYLGELPVCGHCAERGREALLRPHIVWFGEGLDPRHFAEIEAFLAGAEGQDLVFLAAGTSGTVYPAAGFVDLARSAGATTWLVNAEAADNAGRFQHFVEGPSGEVLPRLVRWEPA
jgi:NAD-dependent deacetylase